MKSNRSGFTIVELVVVIAVIGILASLTLVGLSSFSKQARDVQRSTQLTVVAEGLEKYYDNNGEYPSQTSLDGTTNSAQTVAAKLAIDQKDLALPGSTTTNAIVTTDTASTTKVQYIGLVDPNVYATDPTSCSTDTNGGCDGFTLKWIDEATGSVKTISGKHNDRSLVAVNSTSTPPITINDNGSTVVGTATAASCSSDGSVAQYQFQYRVNSGVWSALSAWSTTNNISAGTSIASYKYEFQVSARCYNSTTKSGSTPSALSAIAAYTRPLNTPSQLDPGVNPWPSGTANSATWSWGAANCEAGSVSKYKYKAIINGSVGAETSLADGTTSFSLPTANQGSQYGAVVDVQCYNSVTNTTTPWAPYSSDNDEYIHLINAGSAPSVYLNTTGHGDATAGGVNWSSNWACPSGTTLGYYVMARNTLTADPGWYGPTTALSDTLNFSQQGVQYNYRVKQNCYTSYTNTDSGYTDSGTYLRNVVHFQVSGVSQVVATDGYGWARVDSVNNADGGNVCASGLTARIDVNMFWSALDQNQQYTSNQGTFDSGFITFAGVGTAYKNGSQDFNQLARMARFAFSSGCYQVTTSQALDSAGRGSLGSQYVYGSLRSLMYTSNKWRVSCGTGAIDGGTGDQNAGPGHGFWCDRRYTVTDTIVAGNPSLSQSGCLGTNGGNSSTYRTTNTSGLWTQYNAGC